jgi:hypothetical protein
VAQDHQAQVCAAQVDQDLKVDHHAPAAQAAQDHQAQVCAAQVDQDLKVGNLVPVAQAAHELAEVALAHLARHQQAEAPAQVAAAEVMQPVPSVSKVVLLNDARNQSEKSVKSLMNLWKPHNWAAFRSLKVTVGRFDFLAGHRFQI